MKSGRKPMFSDDVWRKIIAFARRHCNRAAAVKWDANEGTIAWKRRQVRSQKSAVQAKNQPPQSASPAQQPSSEWSVDRAQRDQP